MDPLRKTLQSMYTNTKSAYDKIDEMGGELPANKNLQNLAEAILSIPTGPSLKGLKRALDKGTAQQGYPIGTKLDDEYNGQSNPLIVVKYGVVETPSGQTYMGAYLQRSYATDLGQKWGSNSNDYGASTINTFLNDTYPSRCSADLQSIITEIKVPVVISTGATTVNAKWFLPSAEEVYGLASATGGPGVGLEGEYFPYWKDKTGLSSPSNDKNSGRAVKQNSDSGGLVGWWLRTRYKNISTNAWGVGADGALYPGTSVSSTGNGVLPACVITSSEPLTLSGLKAALNDGTAQAKYPVGAEIPDTYDGQDNPLIVAQYLDSNNNSTYGGADGVILIRKYVEPTSQIFGNSVDYTSSTIKNFLDTTYLNNCSDELKKLISPITIPYYNGSVVALADQKWFLMGGIEIGGTYNTGEGFFWDYWKDKTGLSTPANTRNDGRVMKDSAGATQPIWLRTLNTTTTTVAFVNANGVIDGVTPSTTNGVLPACFIGKD